MLASASPSDASPAAAAAWRLLAPVVAGQPRVRESRDGGRTYPARWERRLTDQLPRVPAAVRVYGKDGTLRCLSADFDVSRGGMDQVDRDATALAELVRRCGGDVIADRSPTGGRHVYVPLAAPVSFTEARLVALALAARFPSMDPMPLLNLTAGCIRPPGSPHKSGGHQALTTPLTRAAALARTPNPPHVWERLVDDLTPQLHDFEAQAGDALDEELTEDPTGGRRPGALPEVYARIARTGVHAYRSDSEARQAVLTSAAARGWPLLDVVRRLESGAWPGLASFYARYGRRHRRQALVRDWRKARSLVNQVAGVHKSHTSVPPSHAARDDRYAARSDDHHFVRRWRTAVSVLERGRYGDRRGGLTPRFLLRALAEAGHKRGSRYLAFGTRSLALATGVDHSTVARHLRALAAEPDPFVVLLENDRGLHGDLYELRIPDQAATRVVVRDLPAGKVHALRPAFRELGVVAALAYEVLERAGQPCTRFDVADGAHISPAAAADALRVLASYDLAVSTDGRWRMGAGSLSSVAELLGVQEFLASLQARYEVERAAWRALLGAVQLSVADMGQPTRPDRAPPESDATNDDFSPIELLERELGAYVIAEHASGTVAGP